MFINTIIGQIAHKVAAAKFERLATPTLRLTYGGKSWGFAADTANYWRVQWWHGLRRGGTIGEYAESTKKHKQRKGLPFDRVTLYETGNLYKSIEIAIKGRDVVFYTDVDYFKYLEERYSEEIKYLHEIKLTEFVEHLKVATIEYFKNLMYGSQ